MPAQIDFRPVELQPIRRGIFIMADQQVTGFQNNLAIDRLAAGIAQVQQIEGCRSR